ncbi:TPA: hypothetical protein DDZ86_02805 [Candidatus Dependentiae bacterium]|nr:MAG: hypothetical protein UW09_C0001G0086 [candidate division TM6 bacterium GW2011_GWF2_43_87]HBL98549.1 hypothetical protein [Candidatus Dependentiae bacterium]
MKFYAFALTVVSLLSTPCCRTDELDQLAHALKQIATAKEPEKVTMDWALKQQYKGSDIFIFKDDINKVYQLKVPAQESAYNCEFHSLRNALYIIKMFTAASQKEFNELYEKMMAPTTDAKKLGIDLTSTKMINTDTVKTLFPDIKPLKWSYMNEHWNYDKLVKQEDIRKKIEEVITTTLAETDDSQDAHKLARLASTFAGNYYLEISFNDVVPLYNHIKTLNKPKEDYTFGIILGWPAGAPHASTVVVHKENDVLYFITADSIDNQIQGGSESTNYSAAFDLLVELIKPPLTTFRDAATRYWSVKTTAPLNDAIEQQNTTNEEIQAILKTLAEDYTAVFKDLEINTNPLFSKQFKDKKSYKELVKETLELFRNSIKIAPSWIKGPIQDLQKVLK